MSSTSPADTSIRVALVNSIEPVHRLVTDMLQPYAPRFRLVSLDDTQHMVPRDAVATAAYAHIALVDMHLGEDPLQRVRALVDDGAAAHVALYATSTSPFLIDAARAVGAAGVVLKGGTPSTLVSALEQIAIGRPVGLDRNPDDAAALTGREHDVLRLLSMGLSNQAIGRELYLGVETIRTHVRQILRKLGVANRTQAALRATELLMDDPLHLDSELPR